MLEALMIFSFVMAGLYLPLRGKKLEDLSDKQLGRLQRAFDRYKRSKKGKNDVDATLESYLPVVGKNGLIYLILGICIVPIYILIIKYLYL